jgi:hypothetical protein
MHATTRLQPLSEGQTILGLPLLLLLRIAGHIGVGRLSQLLDAAPQLLDTVFHAAEGVVDSGGSAAAGADVHAHVEVVQH